MHRIFLICVAGLLLSASALPFTGSLYDPLGLAIEALEAEGFPPPAGYSITEAKPGSLGDIPATTNSDEKTIKVDVATTIEVMENYGNATPDAVIATLMVYLRHEYHHTEDYGTPTVGGGGGYARDFCGHADILDDDFVFECSLICAEADPEVKAALCLHYAGLVEQYNDGVVYWRNKECPGGPYYVVYGCECCD